MTRLDEIENFLKGMNVLIPHEEKNAWGERAVSLHHCRWLVGKLRECENSFKKCERFWYGLQLDLRQAALAQKIIDELRNTMKSIRGEKEK